MAIAEAEVVGLPDEAATAGRISLVETLSGVLDILGLVGDHPTT